MEYLLTKIDHKDQRAVKMAYHIYDQVIKEGYSLIAIRESLTYDRVDIEPVPDRTLENSRVELEQTSDQTEKEKNVHKADNSKNIGSSWQRKKRKRMKSSPLFLNRKKRR